MGDDKANAGASRLKTLVALLEADLADRRELDQNISRLYKEAKAEGFDVKALKALIDRRAKDAGLVGEQNALVDLYAAQLGGVS